MIRHFLEQVTDVHCNQQWSDGQLHFFKNNVEILWWWLRSDRLHGRVVKGVGHFGNDEAMEAGGREFDPRPGHYSRKSF